MKTFTLIFLSILLGLLIIDHANAQSKEFKNYWFYNSIGGIPTEYKAFDYLYTDEPDLGGRGVAVVFQGDPTKEQVAQALFRTEGEIIGKGRFYLVIQSKDPIQFTLDYGYILTPQESLANGEQQLYYDMIKASTGAIGDESNIKYLPRQTVRYRGVETNGVMSSSLWGPIAGSYPEQVLQRQYYEVDRSEVAFFPENLYSKLLIFRFYKYNKVVKTMILPILIGGTSEFLWSTRPGPMELVSILRKPPGSGRPGRQSYTLLESTNETKRKISMSLANTESKENTVGFKGKVGIKAGGIGSASTQVEGSMSQTYTEINSSERTYEVAYTNSKEFRTGDKGDVFIIDHNMWQYGIGISVAGLIVGDEIEVLGPGYSKTANGEWWGIQMLMSPTSEKVPAILDGMTGSWSEFDLKKLIPQWRIENKTALADYF